MSKVCRNVHITKDSKRLILSDLNFELGVDNRDPNAVQNNEFKILSMFQNIFDSSKLEIRNE